MVRVALGVPFVLFLPGYVLTSALFARRTIRRAEVLLLSLAFSVSIVVIGTLILNWLPWGLTTTTWTALLLAVTVIGSAWALLAIPVDDAQKSPPVPTSRRQALLLAFAQLENAFLLRLTLIVSFFVIGALIFEWLPWSPTTPRLKALLIGAAFVFALWAILAIRIDKALEFSPAAQRTLRHVMLVALALVIGVGAIALSRTPLPAKGVAGYSTLWILPGPSGSGTVIVGVQSSELHPTSYRLSVRSTSGKKLDRQLTLQPGQRWIQRFRVERSSRRVSAQLFRNRSPEKVYRRVRLVLRPQLASPAS